MSLREDVLSVTFNGVTRTWATNNRFRCPVSADNPTGFGHMTDAQYDAYKAEQVATVRGQIQDQQNTSAERLAIKNAFQNWASLTAAQKMDALRDAIRLILRELR